MEFGGPEQTAQKKHQVIPLTMTAVADDSKNFNHYLIRLDHRAGNFHPLQIMGKPKSGGSLAQRAQAHSEWLRHCESVDIWCELRHPLEPLNYLGQSVEGGDFILLVSGQSGGRSCSKKITPSDFMQVWRKLFVFRGETVTDVQLPDSKSADFF